MVRPSVEAAAIGPHRPPDESMEAFLKYEHEQRYPEEFALRRGR